MSGRLQVRQSATDPHAAAREASDYFNSLPFEQRKKLAPLLEDYRRMGIQEALGELGSLRNKLQQRVRDIQNGRTLPRD